MKTKYSKKEAINEVNKITKFKKSGNSKLLSPEYWSIKDIDYFFDCSKEHDGDGSNEHPFNNFQSLKKAIDNANKPLMIKATCNHTKNFTLISKTIKIKQ